jgi:hypothetical protein
MHITSILDYSHGALNLLEISLVNIPPQPQVLFWIQLGDTIHVSVGQLVYVHGKPYAILNPPIPGYPNVKLNKDQLQERHDGVLGLPYFVHTGDVIQSPD